MNSDIPYQNQDATSPNPFHTDSSAPVAAKKFILPTDPKIRILLILSIVCIILLIFSAIVSLFRSKAPSLNNNPTPTAIVTPKPTDIIPEINTIPPELKSKFDQIDANNQTNIDFAPPQIDPDIGN